MAGLAQLVLSVFLQFAQSAEARTTAVKEAGVQDAGVAEAIPASNHFRAVGRTNKKVDGRNYTLLELSRADDCFEQTAISALMDDRIGRLNRALGNAEARIYTATREGIDYPGGWCERYERVEKGTELVERCRSIPSLDTGWCTESSVPRYEQSCVDWKSVEKRMWYDSITGAKREGNGWTERDNLIVRTAFDDYNIEFEDEGPVQAAIDAINQIRELRAQLKKDEEAHQTDRLGGYAEAQRRGYKQAQQAYGKRQDIHRKVAQNGLTTETGTMIGRLSPEQQALFRTERECIRNPLTCQSTYH